VHECGKTNYIFCPACVYDEGRKAAENYTEKMLVIAKDEVRKCHEEIRRLEDKYARNVHKMPPYNPSFDEKEHSELVDKGTNAWAGLVDEKGPTEKDFKELLDLANRLRPLAMGYFEPIAREFDDWKKARGIE
jgi:hypothetical protein